MKKIISMGIASAVLALTAIAASADIKATGVEKAANGTNVEVTISTTADIDTFGIVVSATGLETSDDNIAAVGDMKGAKIQEDGSIRITGLKSDGYKAGDTLATITFTVTGENGTDAVVALDNMDGYDEAFENYTLKVEAAGTEDPGDKPVDPEDPTKPADPENPPMGVALAVVPAVLAGAAVVVAKKRK